MTQSPPRDGMPLVLLINDEEWTTRSIESILRPQGYGVLKAYTGRQGLQLAARVTPDLIFVDLHLPDFEGSDLCARLRELPGVRPSIPIIVFTSGTASRSERLQCFRCGAWDLIDAPFDPQELVARLEPYVRAKRDTDLALEGSDLDDSTGCYNARGLMRRLSEVFADTRRNHRPVACVVVGPQSEDAAEGEDASVLSEMAADSVRWIAEMLKEITRASDAVGRMGPKDFVVLAPGTDEEGAARLIERLMELAQARATAAGIEVRPLRVGFSAISGTDPDTPAPEELLRRATSALRDGNGSLVENRIRHIQN